MATTTLSIDPSIRKFNSNSAQFSAGNTSISVSVPETLTGTATYGFGIGNQDVLFDRNKCKYTIQSVNLTNVATYEIWQNGASIGTQASPPSAGTVVAYGSRIYVKITRTNPAAEASIELVADDMKYSFTTVSTTYFYTLDISYAENTGSTETDYYIDTDLGQRFGAHIANYTENFIANEQISGDFEILLDPINGFNGANARAFRGANDGTVSNTVANRFPRIRYCIAITVQNRYNIYEFGTAKLSPFDNDCGIWIFKIEAISGTVKYYHSADNGASWVLDYTSLDTYNTVTDVFNSDLVMLSAGYLIRRPDRVSQL